MGFINQLITGGHHLVELNWISPHASWNYMSFIMKPSGVNMARWQSTQFGISQRSPCLMTRYKLRVGIHMKSHDIQWNHQLNPAKSPWNQYFLLVKAIWTQQKKLIWPMRHCARLFSEMWPMCHSQRPGSTSFHRKHVFFEMMGRWSNIISMGV